MLPNIRAPVGAVGGAVKFLTAATTVAQNRIERSSASTEQSALELVVEPVLLADVVVVTLADGLRTVANLDGAPGQDPVVSHPLPHLVVQYKGIIGTLLHSLASIRPVIAPMSWLLVSDKDSIGAL